MNADEIMHLAKVVARSNHIYGADGEDLESEIMLKLLQLPPAERNQTAFQNVVARNTMLDFVRKRSTLRRRVLLYDDWQVEREAAVSAGGGFIQVGNESVDAFVEHSDPSDMTDLAVLAERAMLLMDPVDQTIVRLRADGLQFTEIACETGMNLSAVKARFFRLQKRMNRLFGEDQ